VNRLVVFVGCALSSVMFAREAGAQGLPAWCGKSNFETTQYDLNDLKRDEPGDIVRALARLRCSKSPEMVPNHANIDKSRATWSKKLGMIEADWADAVAFIDNRDGNFPKVAYSTKTLAQLSPMDQWRAIREGLDLNGKRIADFLYAADALDAQLTEVGRLAFLEDCFKEQLEHDDMFRWAICAPDVAAWSFDKFSAQLRSDTTHDGATKMLLRLRAVELTDKIKTWTTERDKLFKKDGAYKKVFDVAAKARDDWKKGVGSNAKLLELVLAMDSATASASRKQYDGCEATTTAALQAAIATIPAKAFTGMADVRDNPFEGFAHKAGPVLVNTPAVNLAATAYAQCYKLATGISDWLAASLQQVPGVRGPRTAAIGALLSEKFEFDDTSARAPRRPDISERPYSRTGGAINSAGGVVAKVTKKADHLVVQPQKTTAKRVDCVKSHRTNRLYRINSDGTLEYETICDKSAVVTYDTTWTDFLVNPEFAPLLKAGVVFSAVKHYDAKYQDVVAIWPNGKATTPSIVLGAKLK
jgi:hypothetical protein